MILRGRRSLPASVVCSIVLVLVVAYPASGELEFTYSGLVEDTNGSAISVTGWSVPSYVDWDNDGDMDLLVGEGPISGTPAVGKVRVYLNTGTRANPQFLNYSHVQSDGGVLALESSGCLGVFPRTVYWDADGRKDLLVGRSDGTIEIFLNTNTDTSPSFDGGTLVQYGPSGSKTDIDIGARATPTFADWDNDGDIDLVIGGLNGDVYWFNNTAGAGAAPDFDTQTLIFDTPGSRSSPVVCDLDGDGKKDLLVGNTLGELLFYTNTGTDANPIFSGYVNIEADGVVIDLPDSNRIRPFVCDWTDDGLDDILVGYGDHNVHLYEGVPEPATLSLLAIGALMLVRRRKQ